MAERSIYWDLVRVLASTVVVAAHAGLSTGFSLAVPCFAFLLVRLGKRRSGEGLTELTGRHSRALLGPWVVWSLIYLAIRGLGGSRVEVPGQPVVDGVLIGGFIHLWFLPFAFTARVLTQRFDFAESAGKVRLSATIVIVALAMGLSLKQADALGWPRPAPQWMAAAPAALLAWATRTPMAARPFLLAALASLVGLFAATGTPGLGVLAGLLVLDWMQDSLPFARTRWSRALAGLSWPIYLIHPAILIGGQRLLGIEDPYWRLAFALSASAAVGLVILRVPLLRRTLLFGSSA